MEITDDNVLVWCYECRGYGEFPGWEEDSVVCRDCDGNCVLTPSLYHQTFGRFPTMDERA